MWGLIFLLLAAAPNRHSTPKTDLIRLQVLLDRSHFSPGEIDGQFGRVTRSALMAFQAANDLTQTGRPDAPTLRKLESNQENIPTLISYTVTDEDERGPFMTVPNDLMEQAKLAALGYQSPVEELAAMFHSSPAVLRRLNPAIDFSRAGVEIQVPNVHRDSPLKAVSVVVSKSKRTVEALDADGKILALYPATIGSAHDPLPLGNWKVTHVTKNPKFYYNPNLFWDASSADTKAVIQAGPRNPVGVVWIGLTKPHYGIHGTPDPSFIGHVQSHGCVRMTNWDAAELGGMVTAGTPVLFKE
jgi:lipoprotein-anchoring transpeptidase ErfK/SrfK